MNAALSPGRTESAAPRTCAGKLAAALAGGGLSRTDAALMEATSGLREPPQARDLKVLLQATAGRTAAGHCPDAVAQQQVTVQRMAEALQRRLDDQNPVVAVKAALVLRCLMWEAHAEMHAIAVGSPEGRPLPPPVSPLHDVVLRLTDALATALRAVGRERVRRLLADPEDGLLDWDAQSDVAVAALDLLQVLSTAAAINAAEAATDPLLLGVMEAVAIDARRAARILHEAVRQSLDCNKRCASLKVISAELHAKTSRFAQVAFDSVTVVGRINGVFDRWTAVTGPLGVPSDAFRRLPLLPPQVMSVFDFRREWLATNLPAMALSDFLKAGRVAKRSQPPHIVAPADPISPTLVATPSTTAARQSPRRVTAVSDASQISVDALVSIEMTRFGLTFQDDGFVEGCLTDDDGDAAAGGSRTLSEPETIEVPGGGQRRPSSVSKMQQGDVIEERFEIFRGAVLGRGGFGVVRRGWDHENGVFVASKELALSGDEEGTAAAAAALRKEFETLRRVEHPRIVRVLACEIDGPHARIVMEWLPGGSLSAVLRTTGNPFRERVAARYARQLLEAVRCIHAAGLVHRDVKPANLLLDADGNVKLSDFGTARCASQHTARSGTVVGTVPYLAPECFRGEYSPASDMWAVGCTVVELLTGRMPWHEQSITDHVALIFAIGSAKEPVHHPAVPPLDTEKPTPGGPPLATWAPAVSLEARQFLEQCLAARPANRISAAAALHHPWLGGVV